MSKFKAPKSKSHLNRKPWLARIVFDIADDGVTTYTVQRRTTEASEWEVALVPINLTPAVFLCREAAEDFKRGLA